MKKIMMMLVMACVVYGTEAQTKTDIACGAPKEKVCRKTTNGVACYNTKYAEDYAVCKSEAGYYICCEHPNRNNSTFSDAALRKNNMQEPEPEETQPQLQNDCDTYRGDETHVMVAPQSMSYPGRDANMAYNDTRRGTGHIRVCYGGDNVAELNRAPYMGCPTPAYDGPERNRGRNINANNAIESMPPIQGRMW